MIPSHAVVPLLCLFTFGTIVFASPPPYFEKRDNADVLAVIQTLKSSTDVILPQISDLSANGSATSDTVSPLIAEVITALDNASSDLDTLDIATLTKRQTNSDIATLTAGIITDIADALGTLLSDASSIPDLGDLLSGVDTSLNQVLTGLETLLAGVLNLLANLLVDVAGLLEQLAFGLTLASLGF